MSAHTKQAARQREALKRTTLRGFVLVDGRWRRKSWLRNNGLSLYRPTAWDARNPDWVQPSDWDGTPNQRVTNAYKDVRAAMRLIKKAREKETLTSDRLK